MRTFRRQYEGEMVSITAGGEAIKSTARHPFWVVDGDDLERRPVTDELGPDNLPGTQPGRWVEARYLREGDVLLSQENGEVPVESVTIREETVIVHNLQIAECRTYTVGKSGVLVHNASPDDPDRCDLICGDVAEYMVVTFRPKHPPCENHHGILNAWAAANVRGYVSNSSDSPAVTLSTPNHNATRGALNRWRIRKFGSPVGGVMAQVSSDDILELAEEMFDAASVPQAARAEYYVEFNWKYSTSFRP